MPALSSTVPVRPEVKLLSARMGLWLFVSAEIMFFSGLISAFLVFRLSNPAWPPAGQPRLPVWITGFNTVVLLLSGLSINQALSCLKKGRYFRFMEKLSLTLFLGILFLFIQGTEWLKLVSFGLTLNSSVYGGLFYVLIGAHGLHVLGAVVALAVVFTRSLDSKHPINMAADLCRIYWNFVVGIWPLLYVLVYLA